MNRFSIYAARLALGLALVLPPVGCITHHQHPAATQPSTEINPATTQPSFWLDQPAAAFATGTDFDRMITACEDVARDYLFKIDRVDYRAGLVITQPMVSSQWFEPWRRDNHSFNDVEESSMASIRRSIRFEFTRQGEQGGQGTENTWQIVPKILVERQTIAERRITSVVLYRSIFVEARGRMRPSGSREADEGQILQARYWTPVRRDSEFERIIAHDVQQKLNKQ